jgi:hypothetical protein
MALYLISYDIASKDSFEYQPLWDHLEQVGATKILYSEWVLAGNTGQAAAIYDQIAPLTTTADRLLVQEILMDAVWDKLLISNEDFRKLLLSARR